MSLAACKSIYLDVKLLAPRTCMFLFLSDKAKLLLVAVPATLPNSAQERSLFCIAALAWRCPFPSTADWVVVGLHLMLASTCIFLVTKGVEHLLMFVLLLYFCMVEIPVLTFA